MTRSNSVDFTVTGTQIVNAALREVGEIAHGQTPSNALAQDCLESLNMLIKNIMGPTNLFNIGENIWQRSSFTMDLEEKASYTIYNKPTITITDYSAISSGATVSLVLNGTTNTWTEGTDWDAETSNTVTATNLASAINDTTGLSASAVGAVVTIVVHPDYYAHTITLSDTDMTAGNEADIIMDPPIKILSVLRRDSDNSDSPLTKMLLPEYEEIAAKSGTGVPTKYLYQRKYSLGQLILNYVPDDTTDDLVITFLRPLQDLDSLTDNLDFPAEWYRPLKWILAKELCPMLRIPVSKDIMSNAVEAMNWAMRFNPEEVTDYFQPEKY